MTAAHARTRAESYFQKSIYITTKTIAVLTWSKAVGTVISMQLFTA